MRISGATRVAAVVGDPVRHSLSPALHNAGFAAAGLDWVYVAFEVPEGRAASALDAVRTLGIAGLSVTMPHKAAVAAAVDECSPAAAALGAVNCVVNRDGRLLGENTDGVGFLDALRASCDRGPEGWSCVVLGAGGAARAVIHALASAGAGELVVVNRSAERGEAAAALAGERGRTGGPEAVAGADLVVNATSVGMAGGPAPGELPCDPSLLREGQVVVDLVYEPLETPLLREARRRGASAHDGLGMLLHQAARAFEIWTGVAAPLEAMEAAARQQLAARR